MRQATGQEPKPPTPEPSEMARRGALGGAKGGKARARALSPGRRRAIAKKAAKARWGQSKKRG
jgi:hypothetical protein